MHSSYSSYSSFTPIVHFIQSAEIQRSLHSWQLLRTRIPPKHNLRLRATEHICFVPFSSISQNFVGVILLLTPNVAEKINGVDSTLALDIPHHNSTNLVIPFAYLTGLTVLYIYFYNTLVLSNTK